MTLGLLAADAALVHRRMAGDQPPYEGYFHRATLLHHVAGNPTMGPLLAAVSAEDLPDVALVHAASGSGDAAQSIEVGMTTW